MATPAETVASVLTNISHDRRRTVAQYANVEARPGASQVPARLLGDIGFLERTAFIYGQANAANFVMGLDDEARAVTQIGLLAYGHEEDYRRLTSSALEDRILRTKSGATGALLYPDKSGELSLVIPAYCDIDREAVSVDKTNLLVQRAGSVQGPAPHVAISRSGDVIVFLSADAVPAIEGGVTNGFYVAMETCLAIPRVDHNARQFSRVFELPFTEAQLLSLAVLLAKLYTAFPSIPRLFTRDAGPTVEGLWYRLVPDLGITPANFASVLPQDPAEYFGDVYPTESSLDAFVREQGSFDLGREVWRPSSLGRPTTGRQTARTAIASADTMGERSTLLGAYAAIAADERAEEMQGTLRSQIFIQRRRAAHQDSDAAAEQATTTVQAADALTTTTTPAINTSSATYDFTTGRWGDGSTY